MPALIIFIYRLLQFLGSPLIVLYLLWRGARDHAWLRSIPGRFGGLPFGATAPGGIWLHAVSVGEVMSCIPLLGALRSKLPDTPIYVSSTTVAGHSLAHQRLAGLTDGIFYTPLDFTFAVRRILRALRPTLVLIMETEIWPNLWNETKNCGAGLLVINARISDRALPRYLKLRYLFAPILSLPHAIYAQSERDAERYRAVGAPAAKVLLGRNLKYDFDPSLVQAPTDVAAWIHRTAPKQVVIAASTMPGIDDADGDEDDLTLGVYQQLAEHHPELLWIHVPRKPERFDSAAAKFVAAGIPFVRRTMLGPLRLPGVLLLDTIGELSGLFSFAQVVFMGGTLVRRGGHNILEPAFFGKPVVAGPHMENFAEIARLFTESGGLVRVRSAGELAATLDNLISNPDEATRIGAKARETAESQGGATAIALRAAIDLIEESWWKPPHPALNRALLTPFSWLWKWGVERDQRKQLARVRRLPTPTICVGGLVMGGSGKTPMVLHLARRFKDMGLQAAILTRGYKRVRPELATLVRMGDPVPVSFTGDEAQIYVRAAVAHVGIGADRGLVGDLLLQKLPTDVVLLDDGFQHRRLHRDFDLLLLDAQDPWSSGELFPLGRLREPVDGLRRAHAIVLTRCQRGREYRRLIEQIRRLHPTVPIFRAAVHSEVWINFDNSAEYPGHPPHTRFAAFCGLGNPASFWATLRQQGIETSYRWSFGDHHQYRPQDLKRIHHHAVENGAEALLTTEKDCMNLPPNVLQLLAPLPLYWLRIGVTVEEDVKLVQLIGDSAGIIKK